MRQTGLDKMAAGSSQATSSKTQTFNVPIQAGTVVDPDGLQAAIEEVMKRFGFKPNIGIATAGGTF
jgi:hypothetical protein